MSVSVFKSLVESDFKNIDAAQGVSHVCIVAGLRSTPLTLEGRTFAKCKVQSLCHTHFG